MTQKLSLAVFFVGLIVMKLRPSLLAICLVLAAGNGFARAAHVGAVKDIPTPEGGTQSLFAGHYGEIVELPFTWTAEAELRGVMEVVYFHSKVTDGRIHRPFEPKPADYKLENFTRMGLMQLIVIPKNAPGGMRSLQAIRDAKEKEMKQSGLAYKISDVTSDIHWPVGSFHVQIERPYRLWQAYAASAKEFYILTTGGRPVAGGFRHEDFERLDDQGFSKDGLNIYGLNKDLDGAHLDIDAAHDLADESLGKHLLALRRRTLSDYLSYFGDPPWLRLGAFVGAVLILVGWPGTSLRARRTHLFGYSLLLFPLLSGLAGFLIFYIPARFGVNIWRNSEAAEIVLVLLIPWISRAAARRFGSEHPRRVLISTGVLAVLLAAINFKSAAFDLLEPSNRAVFYCTLFLFLAGLPFGIVFSVAFGPMPKKEGHE